MCNICKLWEEKKITSREAFALIEGSIHLSPFNPSKNHLLALSSRILDKDVPMNEINPELDAKFWNQTHKTEEIE